MPAMMPYSKLQLSTLMPERALLARFTQSDARIEKTRDLCNFGSRFVESDPNYINIVDTLNLDKCSFDRLCEALRRLRGTTDNNLQVNDIWQYLSS